MHYIPENIPELRILENSVRTYGSTLRDEYIRQLGPASEYG